jgi:alanyl-tRNA synthetase
MTGLNELRENMHFLFFYESKEQLRPSSFPLVPHNDAQPAAINSGHGAMKKVVPWFGNPALKSA